MSQRTRVGLVNIAFLAGTYLVTIAPAGSLQQIVACLGLFFVGVMAGLWEVWK